MQSSLLLTENVIPLTTFNTVINSFTIYISLFLPIPFWLTCPWGLSLFCSVCHTMLPVDLRLSSACVTHRSIKSHSSWAICQWGMSALLASLSADPWMYLPALMYIVCDLSNQLVCLSGRIMNGYRQRPHCASVRTGLCLKEMRKMWCGCVLSVFFFFQVCLLVFHVAFYFYTLENFLIVAGWKTSLCFW